MALSTEVPALENWITLTEAAGLLGLTRQGVHRKARDGELKTLHRIGEGSNVFVVRRSEIEDLVNSKDALTRSLLGEDNS